MCMFCKCDTVQYWSNNDQKLIVEDAPELDEVAAIERANKSIIDNGTITHDEINWD